MLYRKFWIYPVLFLLLGFFSISPADNEIVSITASSATAQSTDEHADNKCDIYIKDKLKLATTLEIRNLSDLTEGKTTVELDDLIGELNSKKQTYIVNAKGEDPDKNARCDSIIRELEKQKKKLKECDDDYEKVNTAKSEFMSGCSEFTIGKAELECAPAIKACQICPSTEDYDEYDCVKIHNKTSCPALAGEELKEAKERRDEFKEEIEDLEKEIATAQEEASEQEQELEQSLQELDIEFAEETQSLKRETEEAKADLENELKKNNAQISSGVAQAISAVQTELNKSLQVSHTFENELTKAHREYRRERQKIIMGCSTEAKARMSEYRQKRRAAIQFGSYQIPLGTLLAKGRKNFKTTDANRLNRYNRECLLRSKPLFQELKSSLKENLRIIQQKRQQYQANLGQAHDKINGLHQQAAAKQNQFVQEYAVNMDRILVQHAKDINALNQKYRASKKSLLSKTKSLGLLQKRLVDLQRKKEFKERSYLYERELISFLDDEKGVRSSDEENYSKALLSLGDLVGRINIAKNSCSCSDDWQSSETSPTKCSDIERIVNDEKIQIEHSDDSDDSGRGQR